MKAKSRRRLLISSVAMLLVAMLALGTATFAWFTTDSTITTENLSVKTVKASELKLSNVLTDWTSSKLDYDFSSKTLLPASSANGINWWKATGTSRTDGTASGTPTVAGTYDPTKHGIKDYVFMDQLNVANFGGADINNVTISFTLKETAAVGSNKYLRLALVETTSKASSESTALPAFKSGVNFADNVYSAPAGDSAAAIGATATATSTVSGKAVTADASATTQVASREDGGIDVSINIGTLTAATDSTTLSSGGAKYFNLYIWFEGQDTDCKDANAGNSMPEVSFTVTGDADHSTD